MGSIRALGLLLSVVLLVQNVAATQFTVGGSSGWAVPSDNSAVYNQWAERMRFQIGDSLLFVYPSSSDSVLRVTKDDFASCNTASPLEKHADGHTVFTFPQSGPYYFISGNKDNCQKNEKMVVVVLADRSKSSPAPAPSAATPPAPSTETPTPSPVATTTDQTPPSPLPEAPSTPAPTQQATPSGASSFASWRVVVGSFGALAGSAALLAAL